MLKGYVVHAAIDDLGTEKVLEEERDNVRNYRQFCSTLAFTRGYSDNLRYVWPRSIYLSRRRQLLSGMLAGKNGAADLEITCPTPKWL